MDNDLYKTTVAKVGIITIIWNFILSLIKFIGGILANSSSLISDGIHSVSDVLSTIVVMIGAKLSRKKPDNDHPFGHERLESIASFLLAILLGGTAIGLGYNGIIAIIENFSSHKKTLFQEAILCWILPILSTYIASVSAASACPPSPRSFWPGDIMSPAPI